MCLFLMRKKYKCESVSLSWSDGMCPPYIVNVDDDDNPGKVGMKNPPALIPACPTGSSGQLGTAGE